MDTSVHDLKTLSGSKVLELKTIKRGRILSGAEEKEVRHIARRLGGKAEQHILKISRWPMAAQRAKIKAKTTAKRGNSWIQLLLNH